MKIEEIKQLAVDHKCVIEHVSYLAPSSLCEGVYHVYINKDGRNTPVLGDTLEELYKNVKECLLKSNTEKTSLS